MMLITLWGEEEGKNRPWVLGSLIGKGVKLEGGRKIDLFYIFRKKKYYRGVCPLPCLAPTTTTRSLRLISF
jgi:hypothetical protein